MSDIHQKLEEYLKEDEAIDDYLPEEDIILMEKMIDFIMGLDVENFNEDQLDEAISIIDGVADNDISEIFLDEDDELDELFKRKVKIKPSDKRKRKRLYRKARASIKLAARKFRRTTAYKKWKRMRDRKKSQGKTAKGKIIRKFL